MLKIIFITCAALMMIGCHSEKHIDEQEFLNVSSEPTREFYEDYNKRFEKYWEEELRNGAVTINQSHGASGKQANAVIDGTLKADVVTLSISYDVTKIRNAGLIAAAGCWNSQITPLLVIRR